MKTSPIWHQAWIRPGVYENFHGGAPIQLKGHMHGQWNPSSGVFTFAGRDGQNVVLANSEQLEIEDDE